MSTDRAGRCSGGWEGRYLKTRQPSVNRERHVKEVIVTPVRMVTLKLLGGTGLDQVDVASQEPQAGPLLGKG